MAKSNSANLNATESDIITEALQICGVVAAGGTASANQITDCGRTLNYMIKAWMADGLQLWLNEELVVFPVKDQSSLTFAASNGDRMCLSSELVTTKLNGDHASGATSLTVDSITNISASDVIGVVTDDDGIHWTTVSGSPSGTTITLTSGLSSSASDNDRVFTYTTAFTQKVARINNAWIRTTDTIDIPVEVISRKEYVYLSDKTTSGRPNQLYFDPQYLTSVANIWPVFDDNYTNDRLYVYATRYVEDFDASTNDADFPMEWYFPLAYGLAMYAGPKYGVTGQRLNEISTLAVDLKEKALDFDMENQSVFISPNFDGRR